MVDYAQTITNEFKVYSAEPTNKWGALVWGTDEWAYDNDVITDTGKVLSNSSTLSTLLNFDVDKIISENPSLTSEVVKQTDKVLSNSSTLSTSLNFDIDKIISVNPSLTSEIVKDFVGPTITNSLTLDTDESNVTLRDSAGFYHVFRGNTTEGNQQITTDYTESISSDSTWSEVTTPSTSWS